MVSVEAFASEQAARAQPLGEVARRKNQDTVLGAAALGLEADDDPLLDPGMVQSERPQPLQVVRGDLGGGLDLDRELPVGRPGSSDRWIRGRNPWFSIRSRSNALPISRAVSPSSSYRTARPPRRLAWPRLTFRALDPQRASRIPRRS
jgi:hypothetical protein